MNKEDQEKFLESLNRQLKVDNHDFALDERLEIVTTCFDKTIGSVIMQIPDPEELFKFKMCVRKFARVKMRAVNYYHRDLHPHEDFLYKNMQLLRPFMLDSTAK